ncbi:MAG: NAD(P)-dependent oxidoreductase [Planctomycetaceae bacterium]|nr:NAD(P)-dependent oxidoreductase [Planctomycetaceae bacterium]
MPRKINVGIIGIGLLGSAISERLLAEGFDVVGFDLNETARNWFRQQGGTAVDSPAEVLKHASRVIICLPNSKISGELLRNLESRLQPEDLIVDVTTGHPDEMACMGERLAALNVGYLDATVGGSSQQTRDGESIIMVGGTLENIEQGRDVLACFSKEQFHVGPCGAGARMKLVVNLVLGLNRAVLAEGLSFAERNGFDLELALDVLKASPAWSVMMDKKGEKMIHQNYEPQARLTQHLKDVCLILDVGKHNDIPLPLSEIHRQLLETSRDKGFGDADNCAVFEAYRTQNE